MRIRVTGKMNDHKSGLVLRSLLSGTASQQLWREKKYFSRLQKLYILFSMLLTLLTFSLLKELLKANIPLHSIYLKLLSTIQLLEKNVFFFLLYFLMLGLVERKWYFSQAVPNLHVTLSLTRSLTLGKLLFCFIFEHVAHRMIQNFKGTNHQRDTTSPTTILLQLFLLQLSVVT